MGLGVEERIRVEVIGDLDFYKWYGRRVYVRRGYVTLGWRLFGLFVVFCLGFLRGYLFVFIFVWWRRFVGGFFILRGELEEKVICIIYRIFSLVIYV